MKKLLAMLMVLAVVVGVFAGCKKPDGPVGGDGDKDQPIAEGDYTYRTYTSVLPSNWNELTYEDNNDTQILNYIVSPFFEYDYQFENGEKYNENGAVNADAIVAGGFDVKYSAATKLEDVTQSVDEKWGYTEGQEGYAWKITLRKDLKWDDGTPIDAHDFVYTMQQQLDPKFQNMRASTYYVNIQVKNARPYVYQGQSGWFGAEGVYSTIDEANPQDLIINLAGANHNEALGYSSCYVFNYLADYGFVDDNTDAAKFVATMNSAFGGSLAADTALLHGKTLAEIKADATLSTLYEALVTFWQEGPDGGLDFAVTNYTYPAVDFADVGVYAASDYELVVCMDSPIACLKEDGSLSYEAAYSFASLPLVKESLYEACKKAPVEGSTLWTTNYNSSLATSASWGPYKLTEFQSGKSYKLERNENWYGYALEDNQDQYHIDAIFCEVVAEVNTAWMKFLSGQIDDIGLDVDHKDDYRNSKYTYFAPGTGSFGINLYANKDVLASSDRNNGILAIDDFRKAFSLYLDRDEYNATCYTSHRTNLGLLGPAYYYDVENGGVYRDTQQAKEGLLRTYGFTQNEDGTWTDGTNTYPSYEVAYEAMNGMNRTLAKELVQKAYEELTANAESYGYDASKPIELKYGTSTDNANTRRNYEYIKKTFEELVDGTPLAGKINVTFDASTGESWANDFKSGAYDIAAGTGFNGGAFDPAGFLQCYLDPNAGLMYSTWWDVEKEMLTYTMPAGDYEGAGKEHTMSLFNWYSCLNGIAESNGQAYKYNWGTGFVDEAVRLELLAKLEEVVIGKYFTIPTTSEYSATVTGAKFAYITDEYNLFMGFGGMRYLRPQYTDTEWIAFVAANNNNLTTEYTKTE